MPFPLTPATNTDPQAQNKLASPSHSQLHQSHNAEIRAISDKLGYGASTPASDTFMIDNGTGSSRWKKLTSAEMAARVTDETGSTGGGLLMFSNSPQVNSPQVSTAFLDVNGNELIRVPVVPNAVNDITVLNAPLGSSPTIQASGDDNNIDLILQGKGSGRAVINSPVLFKQMDGWTANIGAPSTISNNGMGSYALTYTGQDLTGILSPGYRVRTTRNNPAPVQCASFNGTNQSFARSSVNGMTFTDNFSVSAWVKLSAYPAGDVGFYSRFNGTSGWIFAVKSDGTVYLSGYNGAVTNYRRTITTQSLPLNRWVHVVLTLQMANAASTGYFNGTAVGVQLVTGGTSPTSLVQAGNLEVGSYNNSGFYGGKINQVAVYSGIIPQTMAASIMSQSLTGAETGFISGYTMSNSTTDLNTTNANNLAPLFSATATNADAPFGGQANGTISSTVDYGIIESVTYSTNTTVVVQVPEGCTIPTTGGLSALSYSNDAAPFGMPKETDKWRILRIIVGNSSTYATGNIAGQWGKIANTDVIFPLGKWNVRDKAYITGNSSTASTYTLQSQLSATTPNGSESTEAEDEWRANNNASFLVAQHRHFFPISLNSATSFALYCALLGGGGTQIAYLETNYKTIITLENAYL